MEAELTWNLWRRILQEKSFHEAIYNGKTNNLKNEFGLSEKENTIAQYYAHKPDQVKWFVVGYRFRLVNSFINALETGAPLTLRALLAKNCNISELSKEFLDTIGWKDYGPYVLRYCLATLEFLLKHDKTKNPSGLRDLIKFECCSIQLKMDLANSNFDNCNSMTRLIERTCLGRIYTSSFQLSNWLRNKNNIGIADLKIVTEHYFIYLPNSQSFQKFALLSPRMVELYSVFETPCSYKDISNRLETLGYIPETPEDIKFIGLLESCCAIRIGALKT